MKIKKLQQKPNKSFYKTVLANKLHNVDCVIISLLGALKMQVDYLWNIKNYLKF